MSEIPPSVQSKHHDLEMDSEVLFTPQMVIDRGITRRGITIDDIGVAPTVVVSWGGSVVQSLAAEIGAEPSEHWLHGERQPFFSGEIEGNRVSLVQLPVGSPGTVMIMEEMIACGAQTFLGLGWAGSLQAYAPVGTLLIPTRCIREEGTSAHYVGDNAAIVPDAGLVRLIEAAAEAEGLKTFAGPLWTTDAPYRETRSKIRAYREQGALGVDMETSAMYALGIYRQVRVCNLLVVSDELADEWRVAFGTPELEEATKTAQRVILRFLAQDHSD